MSEELSPSPTSEPQPETPSPQEPPNVPAAEPTHSSSDSIASSDSDPKNKDLTETDASSSVQKDPPPDGNTLTNSQRLTSSPRLQDSKGVADLLGMSSHGSTGDKKKSDLGGKAQDQERLFKDWSTEQLNKRRTFIDKEMNRQLEREDRLSEECTNIEKQIERSDLRQERILKKELQECESKKATCAADRKNLQEELRQITHELEQRKAEGDRNESSTSVEELYKVGGMADDAITNTVLYTATFFESLSPTDFQSVVSKFLEGRQGAVETPLPVKSEDSKSQEDSEKELPPRTQIIQVDLAKRWQDSFYQDNRHLKACNLKSRRESGIPVIDFVNPNMREGLIQFFQDEQPFYVDAQFKRVEELLFHDSETVADRAIHLLADNAIAQNKDWLLDVARKASDLDERFYDRFAELVYQIQLRLEPSQSASILIPFFRALLNAQPENAFDVITQLLYRHLRSDSSFNILNAATQLMNWLRDIADNGDPSQLAAVNMIVLKRILNQKDTHQYLYDFLDIWQTWLPSPDLPYEEYKGSHKLALVLLLEHCSETVLNFDIRQYGKFPSEYALFKPLQDPSSSVCESRLYLLTHWLFFYNTNQKKLALDLIISEVDTDFRCSESLAFIVSEWFAILYGLQNGEDPQPAAKAFARTLLNQIILVTPRTEQGELSERWAELMDKFLDIAEECDQKGDRQKRKEFTARRILVKELKKIFRELQQENA